MVEATNKSVVVNPAEKHKGKRYLLIYLFVLPAFLFHFCFILLPSLGTVWLSFFEWNGVGTPVFNGIANYIEMFGDSSFYKALVNNLKWIACFITIPVFLGLLTAFWISGLKKTQMFMRTVYFLPYVIASAMAGRIWSSYFNPYFGINLVLKNLGLIQNTNQILWLGDEKIALFSVAFVDIWHFWGFVMVLFLGALQQIDPTLYESARVEGATKRQEFTYITVPCMMPTLTFVIITIIMWSFLTFDYVWVMTGGGPGDATEIISTLVYRNAFTRYRAGYANAICVFQSILSILSYWILQVVKKRGYDV